MKLYRLIARFAGQRITLDVNASNDEEAKNNFIKELEISNVGFDILPALKGEDSSAHALRFLLQRSFPRQ